MTRKDRMRTITITIEGLKQPGMIRLPTRQYAAIGRLSSGLKAEDLDLRRHPRAKSQIEEEARLGLVTINQAIFSLFVSKSVRRTGAPLMNALIQYALDLYFFAAHRGGFVFPDAEVDTQQAQRDAANKAHAFALEYAAQFQSRRTTLLRIPRATSILRGFRKLLASLDRERLPSRPQRSIAQGQEEIRSAIDALREAQSG